MISQTNKPAISVITCLYNTPTELFERCLNGLINQTFKDFEVLIVNDGSDKFLDENKALIESFNDSRFKYFDTEHTGKSQTLNFALLQAQGKYIAINDADDVSYPERFEYQHHFLEFNIICDGKMWQTPIISQLGINAVPDNIIFPSTEDSGDVTNYNIYYNAVHPCMMFNKDKVLNNVPFLFEQIYDSMEDNVFNHIMFYSGNIKMYYDDKILIKYSKENPNAAHYDNLHGYKKDGTFKLSFRTFYHDELFKDAQFTCILLVNDIWKEELEKTLLNIIYTSNNVKIIISCYNVLLNEEYYQKYSIEGFLYNKSYNEALSNAIQLCDTEYLMVISKPIRFYIQDWDLYAIRNFQSLYEYNFIQPLLTGIDKIDRDNYYNNNGKDTTYKLRKGQYLILLDKEMTDPKYSIDLYSEYNTVHSIPIIDNDLIFITKRDELIKIFNEKCFETNLLLNVYLSLNEYLTGGSILIDTDIKCGVIDNEMNSFTNIENKFYYYENYWKIVNIFFNETKFLYEKILYENLSKKDVNYILNKIDNDEFIKIKEDIKKNHVYDMGWFLKNVNLKYPITFWANGKIRNV